MHSTQSPSMSLGARIAHGAMLGLLVASPLVMLPMLNNFFTVSKLVLLGVGTVLLLLTFALTAFGKKRLQITLSPLLAPLGFAAVAMLLSTFLAGRYPVENLWGLGGAYLAVLLIAIVGGSILPKKITHFYTALMSAGVILSITSALQMMGAGPSRIINAISPLNVPNDITFSLAGSAFLAVQFLAVALVALIVTVIHRRKLTTFDIVAGLLILIGFVLNGWSVLPGKIAAPLILPYTVSWTVAIDVLKFPRSALIGVGPENFKTAYSIFKPAWVNGADWWGVQFLQSGSGFLTLLATTGLLGLLSWSFLALKSVQLFKKDWKQKDSAGVAAGAVVCTIFVLQLVFPISVLMLTIQGIALAYWIASNRTAVARFQAFSLAVVDATKPLGTVTAPSFLRYASLAVSLLLVAALTFVMGKATYASYHMMQSLVATQENDAIGVYNHQQAAVQHNPYLPAYRRQYAGTNITLARALSQKADITEQERQQVTQLIQQAIREARAATALNETDAQNWAILAQIYQELIGTAEDAPQWTVSTYAQAIQLAPNNPSLRVQLGGIFYGQEQYQQALSLFQQAIDLKPDMANAYYNAANALRELGEYEAAQAAYQQTLVLLDANSEAYQVAAAELEEIEGLIEENADTESTQPAQGESPVPSILNQNVNQSDAQVITEPGTQPLETDPTQTEAEEIPAEEGDAAGDAATQSPAPEQQ